MVAPGRISLSDGGLQLRISKAYGKTGDFVDNVDGDWRLKWQVKVCQTVLIAVQLRGKCKDAEIICI